MSDVRCRQCRMYSTSDAEYCECGAPLREGLKAFSKMASREVAREEEAVCCRLCHIDNVPLASASFRANAGFVIFRVKDNLGGHFCERCIDDAFWKQHTLSAIFGWWGVMSFLSNVVHMPLNVLSYIGAIRELSPRGPLLNLGAWTAWAAGLSAVVIGFTWWLGRYAIEAKGFGYAAVESDTLFRAGFAALWWSVFVLVPLTLALVGRALFRDKSPSGV